MKSFERCCRDISHSITIVGYAGTWYTRFIMIGYKLAIAHIFVINACTNYASHHNVAAAYFVMAGISRIMEARNKYLPSSNADDDAHDKKSNKRKNRKKSVKNNDNEMEEMEEETNGSEKDAGD